MSGKLSRNLRLPGRVIPGAVLAALLLLGLGLSSGLLEFGEKAEELREVGNDSSPELSGRRGLRNLEPTRSSARPPGAALSSRESGRDLGENESPGVDGSPYREDTLSAGQAGRSEGPHRGLEPVGPTAPLEGLLVAESTGNPLARQAFRATFRSARGSTTLGGRTDARGAFTLERLPAEPGVLRVETGSHRPGLRSLPAASRREAVVLHLETGMTITGRVVSSTGEPIERAILRWIPGTASGLSISSVSVKTTSDASGAFRFTGLAPSPGQVLAHRDGHRLSRPESIVPGHLAPLLIELEADAGRPVQVVDPDGQGVPGVKIRWKLPGLGPATVRSLGVRSPRPTDADGQTLIPGLPEAPGSVLITLEGPDRASRTLAGSLEELDRATTARPHRLELEAEARIEGRVLTRDGQPARNVRLTLSGETLRRPRVLSSTSGGEFLFRGLRAGEFRLFADGGERGLASLMLEARTGDALPVEVRLEPAEGVIAGRVVDADRSPRARIPVRLPLEGGVKITHTDASGRFRLESVPEGRHALLAGSIEIGEARLEGVATGTEDVEIIIEGVGTIAGTIHFDGPARPYSIRLAPRDPSSPEGAGRTLRYKLTARDRSFTCRRVPAGVYTLTFEVGGEILDRVEDLRVTAGETRDGLALSENPSNRAEPETS